MKVEEAIKTRLDFLKSARHLLTYELVNEGNEFSRFLLVSAILLAI